MARECGPFMKRRASNNGSGSFQIGEHRIKAGVCVDVKTCLVRCDSVWRDSSPYLAVESQMLNLQVHREP